MPLHAGFTIWNLSFPFPAKQQRQMIKLRFCGEHKHTNLKVFLQIKLLGNPVKLEKQNEPEQLQNTVV